MPCRDTASGNKELEIHQALLNSGYCGAVFRDHRKENLQVDRHSLTPDAKKVIPFPGKIPLHYRPSHIKVFDSVLRMLKNATC
ncbi:unnamed protein product [Leptosia nina]|uniref:Uncharacterized protein n=1 Tax=Leptosia nina TaxID=320188 RepID=A0AAV1JKE5_9NEOP